MLHRYTLSIITACSLAACAESKSFNSNEKTQVQPKAAEQKPQPPKSIEAEVTPQPPATVPERCDGASLKVVTQSISFPERRGCSFGKGRNLPPVDGQLQAVETQTQELQLPAGLLCDVSIASPTDDAQLHYDDVMVLTLDNRVLLSSSDDVIRLLDKDEDVFSWDFTKVSGRRVNFDSAPYCLNTADEACLLPVTDTAGPVKISLDAQSIAPISSSIEGKTSVPVSLHMLGDNDNRDCYHTQLDFVLNLKYLAK